MSDGLSSARVQPIVLSTPFVTKTSGRLAEHLPIARFLVQ